MLPPQRERVRQASWCALQGQSLCTCLRSVSEPLQKKVDQGGMLGLPFMIFQVCVPGRDGLLSPMRKSEKVGASQMTTKFLTIKFAKFQILLSWNFPG